MMMMMMTTTTMGGGFGGGDSLLLPLEQGCKFYPGLPLLVDLVPWGQCSHWAGASWIQSFNQQLLLDLAIGSQILGPWAGERGHGWQDAGMARKELTNTFDSHSFVPTCPL
jgi:hypothetical protein